MPEFDEGPGRTGTIPSGREQRERDFRESFSSERIGSGLSTSESNERARQRRLNAFFNDPFISGGQGSPGLTRQEFIESPFEGSEFERLQGLFGSRFQGAQGIDRSRFREQLERGGLPTSSRDLFGLGPSGPGISGMKVPQWLANLYGADEGESLGSVYNRALQGAQEWLAGGPNAPNVLSPNELQQLLPSEREALQGFLELVGIPFDDYEFLSNQQQNAVLARWAPQTRPARQF